jgi:hypothetical protein
MLVTEVATVRDGSLVAAVGQRQLTTLVDGAFAQALYVRLPNVGAADRIVIPSQGARLQGQFTPHAELVPASALASGGDGTVFVTLSGLRHVTSVRFAAPAPPAGATCKAELYRLDGSRRAETPSVIASVDSNHLATFTGNFTDVRFAIGLRSSASETDLWPLSTGHISEVHASSDPGAPMITLSVLDSPARSSPSLLFPDPARPGSTAIDAGPIFVRELTRLLSELVPPLPDPVEIQLTFASSTPCDLALSTFQVDYALVQERFASGPSGSPPPKQVLRFSSGVNEQSVEIDMLRTAIVDSANLRAVLSLRSDRATPSAVTEEDGRRTPIPMELQGTWLEPGRVAGQTVRLGEALSASGVALGVLTTASGARLRAEIQPDWNGRPSGRKLTEASVELGEAGARKWVSLLFEAPVVFTTDPHWLLVSLASGGALWLLANDEATVNLFEAPKDPRSAFVPLGALRGFQGLYHYFSRAESAGALTPDPGCVVWIGEQQVAPDNPAADERHYDISGALTAYLGAQSTSATSVRVPIRFVSATAGLATVYPPTIQYRRD